MSIILLTSFNEIIHSVFDISTACLQWTSCIDEGLKIICWVYVTLNSPQKHCSILWRVRWTDMGRLFIRDICLIHCRKRHWQIQKATQKVSTQKNYSFIPIMTLHFWWKGDRVMTSVCCSMQTQQARELIRSRYST
jgi:hypothetical protein